MKLKMTCNLGRTHATALDVDHRDFCEGQTVDVDEALGDRLIRLGVAESPERKKPAAKAEKADKPARPKKTGSVTGDLADDPLKS